MVKLMQVSEIASLIKIRRSRRRWKNGVTLLSSSCLFGNWLSTLTHCGLVLFRFYWVPVIFALVKVFSVLHFGFDLINSDYHIRWWIHVYMLRIFTLVWLVANCLFLSSKIEVRKTRVDWSTLWLNDCNIPFLQEDNKEVLLLHCWWFFKSPYIILIYLWWFLCCQKKNSSC